MTLNASITIKVMARRPGTLMSSLITNRSSNIQKQSSIIRNWSRMTQAYCTTSTMIRNMETDKEAPNTSRWKRQERRARTTTTMSDGQVSQLRRVNLSLWRYISPRLD